MNRNVPTRSSILFSLALFCVFSVHAEVTDFSGNWSIDLRDANESARNAECGRASFKLAQKGNRVTGSHEMSTVGCGRVNEGGDGTVQGAVSGNRAILLVTSGRNGAVVKGVATIESGMLHWVMTDQVKAGDPAGDSPLILAEGVLTADEKSRHPTLCEPSEKTIWSCSAKAKLYSLCLTAAKPSGLWYRAGTPRHVEFTFPSSPGRPKDFFKYDLRGKLATVSFVNGRYVYQINENIYGQANIEIEKDGKSIGNVECGASSDTLTLTATMNLFQALEIDRTH